MDDHIRTAMAAYEPKRIERVGMERAAVLVAIYDKDDVSHILFQVRRLWGSLRTEVRSLSRSALVAAGFNPQTGFTPPRHHPLRANVLAP